MQGKVCIGIVIIGIIFNFALVYSQTEGERIEVLKKLCSVSPVKEGMHYVCPICPEFTDFSGEDYDRFIVTEVISGRFISGKEVKFIGYFGCEPRMRNYGGYLVIVREKEGAERMIVDEEREYLGRCRKVSGKDRDLIKCRGGDAYRVRPDWWRVLCEFRQDGTLKCKRKRR